MTGFGTYKNRIVPTMIEPRECPFTVRAKHGKSLSLVGVFETKEKAIKACMRGTFLIFRKEELICTITNKDTNG